MLSPFSHLSLLLLHWHLWGWGGGGRGGCSTAYLSVELPEVSGCCVSVESVTQAFPLPIFCFLGHSLEYFCLFLHLCLNSQIWVRLASFFLPQLHHGMLVSLSCLGFLLPPGWSDDDFLFRICCVSWFASLHLSHPTYVWLAILERILGFQSWFISWFLYTEDYREVITPVLCQGFCTFPWCQLWGHQCQVDCTASVPLSSCRVPGWVELAVDTGVKRASLSIPCNAHPCWLVPCLSHKLDCALKSLHIMIVIPSAPSIYLVKEIPTCSCGAGGGVYACIDESQGLVSLIWLFYSNTLRFVWAFGLLIQDKGEYCLAEIPPSCYCH